jgi:plastocyanin
MLIYPLTLVPAQPSTAQIILTSSGPQPSKVTIHAGDSITWASALDDEASAQDLADLNENPISQPRSNLLDPLLNVRGFDGGTLRPGEVYKRVFPTGGIYTYSDGYGHVGTIVVEQHVYLPLLLK